MFWGLFSFYLSDRPFCLLCRNYFIFCADQRACVRLCERDDLFVHDVRWPSRWNEFGQRACPPPPPPPRRPEKKIVSRGDRDRPVRDKLGCTASPNSVPTCRERSTTHRDEIRSAWKRCTLSRRTLFARCSMFGRLARGRKVNRV